MSIKHDVCLAGAPAINGICGELDCVCCPELIEGATRISKIIDDAPGPAGYYRGEHTSDGPRQIRFSPTADFSVIEIVPAADAVYLDKSAFEMLDS